MARVPVVSCSKTYFDLESSRVALDELNDCGVKALAIATERSYEAARKLLQKNGRKHRGATEFQVFWKSLEELGFQRRDVTEELENLIPARSDGTRRNYTTYTPRRFPGTLPADKVYIITCRGHVLAASGGMVHDWSINRSLRVCGIYEVTK